MKTLTAIIALLALALPAAAATYECTDSQGRRSYTSNPGPNCRDANLGKPSVYTPAPPVSVSGSSYVAPNTPSNETANSAEGGNVSSAALRAAEERLAEAKRNLDAGRQVRYGNERNYARYLERIKGLEDAVSAAEKNLNDLKPQP